jgi:hypothetical protein
MMIDKSTPIDKFSDLMQSVIKEFERQLPRKAPYLVGKILVRGVPYLSLELDNKPLERIKIYDSRLPIDQNNDPIVTVNAIHNGEERKLRVFSRTILNERFKHSDRKHEKISNNVASTVRTLLKHTCLYTREELYESNHNYLSGVISDWLNEHREYARRFADYMPREHQEEFIAEYKHLKQLGVPFISSLFQKLGDLDLEVYETHFVRKKQDVRCYHVKEIGGRVSVLEFISNYTKDFRFDEHYENIYESFDELPKSIAGEIAMLKMLSDRDKIRGVGVRVSHDEYYLIEPLGNTTNS